VPLCENKLSLLVALCEMPSCDDIGIAVRQWGDEYGGISISEPGVWVAPSRQGREPHLRLGKGRSGSRSLFNQGWPLKFLTLRGPSAGSGAKGMSQVGETMVDDSRWAPKCGSGSGGSNRTRQAESPSADPTTKRGKGPRAPGCHPR
jgi:hypothetical protein